MQFNNEVKPGRDGRTIDWQALKQEILAKLDVAAEYRALGVEFTRATPNAKGILECHAVGRKDDVPSAMVNIKTGIYHDSGTDESLNLWDFALKHGSFGRHIEVVRHYGEKAGVEVPTPHYHAGGKIREAEYDYTDEAGAVLFRVFRYRLPTGKKTFSQHPPDGRGGWKHGAGAMDGVRLVPYRLRELTDADPDDPVWIVEGEKDADRLAGLGLVATCNPMGAGKWREEFARYFAGRDCYVLPDHDQAGLKHGLTVCGSLHGTARTVKLLELPDLPVKGDVSDWLDAGGTVEELGRLAHAAPVWDPAAEGLVAAEEEEEKPPRRPANLADLRRTLSDVRWIWEGWLPAARISGIAALEGCGKSRFTLDLARRVFHGMPWPDGQPPSFPAGTPTLWICADGNQDDLAEAVQMFDLPDEAVIFNTVPEEVYGGTDLDSEDVLADLEEFIPLVRPAFVVIDTLTNATRRDLCRQNEVKIVMTPLKEIAQRFQTSIITQLHLSRDGQALGRRIRGLTRTLIHIESPDPEGQPDRRRLWVEKTFAKKPAPLGITMTDRGNIYDTEPPQVATAAPRNVGGRPATEHDRARRFILDGIQHGCRPLAPLLNEFLGAGGAKNTFFRARDAMVESGEITCDGSPKVIRPVDHAHVNGVVNGAPY